ncbi:unnamed protein product, partial [Symbiodinium natans]
AALEEEDARERRQAPLTDILVADAQGRAGHIAACPFGWGRSSGCKARRKGTSSTTRASCWRMRSPSVRSWRRRWWRMTRSGSQRANGA